MRCPVCWSPKTLLVLSRTSHGRCEACGTTWMWSGGEVTRIRRSMGAVSPAPEDDPYGRRTAVS
jgi:hypothetical protein